MVKFSPILFSPIMVEAILSGRKTQTRRVMKTQMPENFWRVGGIDTAGEYAYAVPLADDEKDDHLVKECKFPYGNIGDVLWVRETFWQYGRYVETGKKTKSGRPETTFKPEYDLTFTLEDYGVRFSHPLPLVRTRFDLGFHRRPSIFLEQKYSRIKLEITGIRVERLKDISEDDAKAEGAMYHNGGQIGHSGWRHEYRDVYSTAKDSFFSLWRNINGNQSLISNPWVWAIDFKVVQ